MIRFINFYHEKSTKFFITSLSLILTSYCGKYILQIMIPESRWERVPLFLSFIISIVLIGRINQQDIQLSQQTLANTVPQSVFEKIAAKYVLSYAQLIIIGATNLVFNYATLSLGVIELLFLALECAVYLAGMISYFILFKGIISKLRLSTISKKCLIGFGWLSIILLNGAARYYFPQNLNNLPLLNNTAFYPSMFLLNVFLSAIIVFAYVWLEKNQSA